MNQIKSELLKNFENLTHCFLYDFQQEDLKNITKRYLLKDILTLNQIHSDNVILLDDSKADFKNIKGDSIVTKQKNIGIGIFTADCVPILIYEANHEYISVIHAGWRGSFSEITIKTLKKMNNLLDSDKKDYFAVIGPAIGRCCYEVGNDVASLFLSRFNYSNKFLKKSGNGKYLLDLVKFNELQLRSLGVTRIEILDNCTKCNDFMPSYRRDGKYAGRMLSFIGLL
ncbi:MAG: peptidoglycan editing factor PgeF [Candidatus Dadabacteria bacterium]|nr:peptidoglycan editing factor PgeF [Candidatus Dadabacteria bacterium]NIQ16218.1 peptidoglycan editing factor PgeF [Candidatus Dadabacteria bacterium]